MKTKTILAISLLLIVSAVGYRSSQLPSLLTVAVRLNLERIGNQSDLIEMPVVPIVTLTSTNQSYDNVISHHASFGNRTSDAYWELRIVLNQSVNGEWDHYILPGPGSAGTYLVFVSKSFSVIGTFSLSVIVVSINNKDSLTLSTFSEIVTVR